MGRESEAKRLGRVEYVEPNNLFVTSDGNKVQNGIPQPYEDYSFSVNLRVINGDRYGCGMTGDGGDISKDTIEFSSDKGTLSFMDGTTAGGQGYLTTNFTDISMNDPSTNTKECLGIESISVSYDSWYYPTVNIRFIDVRGASLMQPAEYEYYNTGGSTKSEYRKSNSDFFKAFFSFPYPLFRLSIKGFYGKEVTYDLSVLSCNVEFNSSTGNFEVNADFIGYMYGMYSDLPFPFVYLAPYINLYGKNTWDEKRITGDFCYLTSDKNNPIGEPMYTFPELKRAVENAGQAADKEIEDSPEGKKRIELENLTKKLSQEVIANYPMTSGHYTWWSWSKTNTKEDRAGYFFISLPKSNETNTKIFFDFADFSRYLQEYNVMAEKTDHHKNAVIKTMSIFDSIFKETNAFLDTEQLSSGASIAAFASKFSNDVIEKIIDENIVSLAFHKDENENDKKKSVLIFDSTNSNFGTAKQSDYTDLINELIKRFNEDQVKSPMQRDSVQKEWTIRAFKFDDITYKSSIVEILNNLQKELDELVKELDKRRNLDIIKAIKFKPTIRNMYNMIFAHIDTFMSTFYNTLDRIRKSIQSSTDNSRKFENLCGGSIQCDVDENTLKSNSSNGGKLPPFTMFYKEESEKDGEDKKVSMVWPGSLRGGKELEEVKLVEAIINATALNRKSFDPVTPEYNIIKREGNLAPINYYDIIREKGNPYLDILNTKSLSDEKVVYDVLKVFVLRCYYALMNGSYVAPDAGSSNNGQSTSTANFTKKAKLIAELEVGNVERAFNMLKMKPTKAFLTGLNKLSTDGSTLMSNYTTGEKPMFTSYADGGDLKYNWLTKSDGDAELFKFLPVGIFNNQTLVNYAAGANLEGDTDKFLKINNSGTSVNSFSCYLYSGGKRLESILSKYGGSGDFSMASKLFPNYNSVPQSITGLDYFNEVLKTDILPAVPSSRKSDAGETSIFMDPLYYAQKSRAARAYLFLMGIPFSKDKKFFLPERVENGDYPTLLLLREGAVYWRGDKPLYDPITYDYEINGSTINVLDDIERNDPCLGQKVALAFYNKPPKYASEARISTLLNYFLKWADGGLPEYSVSAETYVNIEIPAPSMSFQEIESRLALQEINGGLKQILTPDSCASAVTVECAYASTFANATSLKECYAVGPDDKLGKPNGKIRTGVYIIEKESSQGSSGTQTNTDSARKSIYTIAAEILGYDKEAMAKMASSQNSTKFLSDFKKFYFGSDTILDFSCFDNPSAKFTVPKNAMNDAASAFISGLKDANKISIEYLKTHTGADSTGVPEDSSSMPEYFTSDSLKLACYMALKNMYDRWLCNRRRESWNFSCIPDRMSTSEIKSDFLRFFYVDEFYHEIGMRAKPNLTNTINKIVDLGGFSEKSTEENLVASSIMKVLSFTAQYAGCALLALPTMLGLAKTYTADEDNSIANVFKAYPYNEAVRSDGIESSFVTLYSNQKSSKLDVKFDSGKMAYKTDGFDIANTWGEIVPQVMFTDSNEDDYVIPSFGVTFAKQNQSYFKDLKLSMQDHQVTDFSIRNEVMISYQNNKGPRETAIVGQDLYSVYSNYSYSCTVTMMGDAQITPLMYFQLNNIAMWKGAYMITNVKHSITTNGMETVFTGVRQSRYSVPFVEDDMLMPAPDAAGQTPQSQGETSQAPTDKENLDISKRPLDLINVEEVNNIVFILDRTSLQTSDKWVNGFLSARVYYEDGRIMDYDIAQTIEATFGLVKNMGTNDGKIENFTPPSDNSVIFCLPAGKYSSVVIENPYVGEEYRDPNDSFYKFTDGKHITVNDKRLGYRCCEIITGETSYNKFENGGFSEISLGRIAPIMLYPPLEPDLNKQINKSEIRATYREIFDLIKRMCNAKKTPSFLINENQDIQNTHG